MLLDGAMARLGAGLVRWGGKALAAAVSHEPAHLASRGRREKARRRKSRVKIPRTRHLFLEVGNRNRSFLPLCLPSFPIRQTFSNFEIELAEILAESVLVPSSPWWLPKRSGGDDAAHHEAAPGTEAQ